ncbi:PAS domain S-box protein [Luteimonas sp. SX5]|uniref:histidine kinase n=1 Tax=Luteimonas galliterrae TaxID=2940486 RepID=A0ABT0MFY3_9GAMM|nr:PAS domain-containing sensor histidine kinase [Luteimonas galliterrae]MCL1633523.1 PAS domain S-box protein [Luteimonas galliterrae]
MSAAHVVKTTAIGSIPLIDDEQQFRLLVQSVTDYAIYMLDPDGVISNWNPGGERIKGYTREEIVGQHFSRFYTEEDRLAGEPEYGLRMAREHGKYEKEGWRLRKDGSRFRASVVIDPIWQDGRLIGYAKITRDITERYEAQKRLELAQRALAQSQKIEAVGKLTFGLAHDFNNLLTVIINSLELIKAHPDDAERVGRLVDGAVRAADRGALLTRQLLAFARGQNLAPEWHDVNGLLARSESLYRRACDTAIDVRFELGEGLPAVFVDAAQFEAAVLNLVVNSRDAMPDGGTIRIGTCLRYASPPDKADAVERRYVCVTVADNGTGMSAAVQERAIEPFYTTKEVGKGSGLGLSQVHGFAAQSGGFADIVSQLGTGTRVSICLPADGEGEGEGEGER